MSEYKELEGNLLMFECPYDDCKVYIIVQRHEINCGIFRCNPYLAPHASKEECEAHKNKGFGCCRPIQFKEGLFVQCGYI